MKLHANAALSLNRRRLLCRRVVDEHWTLSRAAATAEVSTRCARKWVARYLAEGELGLLDRSSAPRSIPHRTSEQRVQAIAALRRLRFTGPEIAETLRMAPSTVSGILTRIGMGRLGRLGLQPARRYERQRPGELIHVDIKKLGRIQGWRRASHPRAQTQQPRQARCRRRRPATGRLGVRAHRDRRLHPSGLCRGTRRREGDHGGWLPSPCRGVLRAPRHERRATADRQRLWLSLDDPRDRLSGAGDLPSAHSRLQASDQRQGRALHPHAPGWLGLRCDLPGLERAHARP